MNRLAPLVAILACLGGGLVATGVGQQPAGGSPASLPAPAGAYGVTPSALFGAAVPDGGTGGEPERAALEGTALEGASEATERPAGIDRYLRANDTNRWLIEPAAGQMDAVAADLAERGAQVATAGPTVLDVTAPALETEDLVRSGAVRRAQPAAEAHPTAQSALGRSPDGSDSGLPLVDYLGTAAAAAHVVAAGEGALSLGVAAWHAKGYTGAGIRLAIIDTGFRDWADAAAAGRVSANTELDIDLCDAGFERTNHGTATAEVIRDMAPGATIVRVCIDDAADLAASIDRLVAARVSIVNMSLGFYNTAAGDGLGGPGSPDDSARRAIAAGITWVNSAGNESLVHYAGDAVDADGDARLEFAPGDEDLAFVLPPGGKVDIYVKWADWQRVLNRFELCLTDDAAGNYTCFGDQTQLTGAPVAALGLTNPFDRPVTIYAQLRRLAGSDPVRVDAFFVGAASLEHAVAAGSLVEPAAVDGVVAVGALCTTDNRVRPTSSQGRTLDGRVGISLVAPGTVSNYVFGAASGCRGGYEGTSVAAAHVAGALALLRQAVGDRALGELLARSAAAGDLGSAGVDPVYGVGRLELGPPPPAPDPTLPPDPGGPLGPVEDGGFALALSSSADRGDARPLEGALLAGDAYVFVTPIHSGNVAEVRFLVDGRLQQVERLSGFDLGGGRSDRAYPFDTTRLGAGAHRITASVLTRDGVTWQLGASVEVDNGGAPPGPAATRLDFEAGGRTGALNGASVEGNVTLGVTGLPEGQITGVLYYIDAVLVGWSSGVEPVRADSAVDLARFGPGEHMSQAIADYADGRVVTANATFEVPVAL
ncbi:MAG: S8 family serine peptidase [Acidimicrobiia bacterium]|nr:S8 family serine peptidase [Acidimicrobiia bacterium]